MYPAPVVTRDTFKAVAVTIEDFTPGLNEPLSSIGLQVKSPDKVMGKRNKLFDFVRRSHFLSRIFQFLFLVTRQGDGEGGCLTKPQFVPPTYKNGICLAIPPDQLPFSSEPSAIVLEL